MAGDEPTSDAFRVDTLSGPNGSTIGLCRCPGRSAGMETGDIETGGMQLVDMQPDGTNFSCAPTDDSFHSLRADIGQIESTGATMLITLLAANEMPARHIQLIGELARGYQMAWLHLPVTDMDVPGPHFERIWQRNRKQLTTRLNNGQTLVLHCRAGLGRSGIIACRLLVQAGVKPIDALRMVRAARPGAVETAEQERWVLSLAQ